MPMHKRTIVVSSVRERALAKSAAKRGITVAELISEYILAGLTADGTIDSQEQRKIQLRKELVAKIAEVAADIASKSKAAGEPDHEDIIFEVIDTCTQDGLWWRKYQEYIGGGDIRASGVHAKGINKQFGSTIKDAVKGTVKLNAQGAPVVKRAKDAIIQSFTVLESYEAAA